MICGWCLGLLLRFPLNSCLSGSPALPVSTWGRLECGPVVRHNVTGRLLRKRFPKRGPSIVTIVTIVNHAYAKYMTEVKLKKQYHDGPYRSK
jgi:hypothetical protein